MCALQRTSGAKLSVSAAVPRGLALLADAQAWRLTSLPHEGHRSRLALAPQGVADTERVGVWHGFGDLGR